MKKNIIKFINQNDVDKLLSLSKKLNLNILMKDGVLLNNYFIETENKIKIEKVIRKYIYITENYLNEWSSNYKIILTNEKIK